MSMFAFSERVRARLRTRLLEIAPPPSRPVVQPRPVSSAPEPVWNEEELAEIWGRQMMYTRR